MSKRLTIMYRAGITTERASQLISADDASIVCWDDVFAERDAMAQRCRELEAERNAAAEAAGNTASANHNLLRERDALRAEVERLQAKLRRIESVAECGSVQSWLALPDAAKAQWFALHLEREDERLADAARLQWLADNMRLMSGHKETGHYQLPELVEWVESGREGCTLDDLRAAIDALPEAI